jgi:hypothetical protein
MIEKDTMSDCSDKTKSKYICRVCGAGATCFNFDVESSESCKAFFRRNASDFENKEFECKNGCNCIITETTRKTCRKCRIDKCFNVGMKKDWILNETERVALQCKKIENRMKKLQASNLSQDTTQSFNLGLLQDHDYTGMNSLVRLPLNATENQNFNKRVNKRRRRFGTKNS